jgi:eukaryotic translation initiation factor 2C
MKAFMENRTSEVPLTCINLLDLLYRQNRLNSHVYEKRSLFKIDDKNNRGETLGDGLIYFSGQYQSVKACESSWLQNMDIESCIFYDPTSVVDFLKRSHVNVNPNCEMSAEDVKKAEKLLRNLLIVPSHVKEKKYKVNRLEKSANKYEFDLVDFKERALPENERPKAQRVSVAQYFKDSHKITLKYPNLPCVSVGDPRNPICFPMELCHLAMGVRYNRKLNPDQQAKIGKVFRKINFIN